jgi:hypothetical protein
MYVCMYVCIYVCKNKVEIEQCCHYVFSSAIYFLILLWCKNLHPSTWENITL